MGRETSAVTDIENHHNLAAVQGLEPVPELVVGYSGLPRQVVIDFLVPRQLASPPSGSGPASASKDSLLARSCFLSTFAASNASALAMS